MKNCKWICLFSILAMSGTLQAQTPWVNGDTVRWNSASFTDLLSDTTVNIPCQFVLYGLQRVDWVQANGGYITSFSTTNTAGSWTDITVNGSITIGIAANQLTGQIVFTRTDQGIKADLTINGGSSGIKNSYTVTSFEKL